MKKSSLFILAALIFPLFASAAMNPALKECLQRGYKTETENDQTYCVFPDGAKCAIESFNQGVCGQSYMIEDYCVEEGGYVWDKDRCCTGTEAYLPPMHAGQEMCRDIKLPQKIYDQIRYQPHLRIGLPIAAVLVFAFLRIFIVRKKR